MNYIVEDKIDFWAEVNSDTVNDETLCMLTKTPLTRNHIILPCGHKFNYSGLVREMEAQRKATRFRCQQRLPQGSTKCPYCRVIHTGMILWIPGLGVSHTTGVTSNKYAMPHRHCCYNYKSGKMKGERCKSWKAYETDIGCFCPSHATSHRKGLERQANKVLDVKKKKASLEESKELVEASRPGLLKRKNAELKAVLAANNLPVSGTKITLAKRVMDNNLVVAA